MKNKSGHYLSGALDGSVCLEDKLNHQPHACEMWTPCRNDDNTWSFKSYYGAWLSACRDDQIVCTTPQNLASEHFSLDARSDVPYGNQADQSCSRCRCSLGIVLAVVLASIAFYVLVTQQLRHYND